MGAPGWPMHRRVRFLATSPCRLRISHAVERAGSSQPRCRRSITASSLPAAPRRMVASAASISARTMCSAGTVRRRVGFGGAILEALRAVVQIAIDPFVAGLATDAVIRAQFADRQAAPEVIGDELRLLVHG